MPLTLRRFLLLAYGPGKGILLEALDHLQHHWEIGDPFEEDLRRAVAIDQEDYSSQNKLRLLYMCRSLCRFSTKQDMSIALISTQVVGLRKAITYAILS